MNTPLLHHYPLSPYSEKIRLMFGHKRMAWLSVETPIQLPKPDLVALTGGYRKAPVLQVGRDIYCDSALIARVLDRLAPAPPLVPAGHKASCAAFAALEQTLFFAAVSTLFQPAGLKVLMERLGPEAMQRFAEDRARLFVGGTQSRPGPDFGRIHYLPLMNALDRQLAESPFLLGEAPTLADFCMAHPVWFVRGNAGIAGTLEPFHALAAWSARMAAIGHGQPSACSGEEALAIARDCGDWQPLDGPVLEPDGVRLGMEVALAATDYGVDPVIGRLVHASVFELVVARDDARAGALRVHAPRAGFKVTPVAAG